MKSISKSAVVMLFLAIFSCPIAGSAMAEQVHFYHVDPAGTAQAMTDSTGTVIWKAQYKPFGEVQDLDDPSYNSKKFLGKELDEETEFYHLGARYMEPKVGRFFSPDPVRAVDPLSGSVNSVILNEPQRLNVYAYSGNNPYRYADPDGNIFWDIADVGFAAYSAFNFVTNPSWLTALELGADAIGCLPGIPSLGAVNAGRRLAKNAIAEAGEQASRQGLKKAVQEGGEESIDLYRVYGGKAKADGFSWTDVNPNTVDNYRDAAGLPDVNTGRFVVEGRARKKDVIRTREALPLEGNRGGLNEIIIDPKNVSKTRVSGVNPEF